MRLNLGCGRTTFPTRQGNPITAHLDYYLPTSAYSDLWINVDKHQHPGVDEVIDLFTYPWIRSSNGNPFNDSSVDEIWASHLVEHIPHDAKLGPGARMYPDADDYTIDGWFRWMYEAWRILKPGGLLHLVIPWPIGRAGMADPTHRRYVHPGVFSYTATPNPDAPFDYHITTHFETVTPPTARVNLGDPRIPDGLEDDDLLEWAYKQIDIIDEYYIGLEAIKDE